MRRAAAAILVALVAGSIGASAILLQPGRTRGDAFLFGDEGHNIWVASALGDGVELYSGAYSLYGPAAGGG